MNVAEIQALRTSLAAKISALIQDFETQTGCIVHSVPVFPAEDKTPTSVIVKVQIP